MRKIRLTISYDGTNYVGWQSQPNGVSIQEVLQEALGRVVGMGVNIIAAGRTDAGVHAIGQVAHASVDTDMPLSGIKAAVNDILPGDIAVTAVDEVSESFHALRDARSKLYSYLIAAGDEKMPLLRDRAWQVDVELDSSAMREAAGCLVGTHDFESFRASGCASPDSVRTITRLDITDQPILDLHAAEGRLMRIDVEGDSFLRHMVRNIVGTLYEVGRGYFNRGDVGRILMEKNRRAAGLCAPACGLYLVSVKY
jgi:tRNA pseudouridine38-40 synthase